MCPGIRAAIIFKRASHQRCGDDSRAAGAEVRAPSLCCPFLLNYLHATLSEQSVNINTPIGKIRLYFAMSNSLGGFPARVKWAKLYFLDARAKREVSTCMLCRNGHEDLVRPGPGSRFMMSSIDTSRH